MVHLSEVRVRVRVRLYPQVILGQVDPRTTDYEPLGHHFQGQKVKGQGHQAALITAVLARQAAAAVGVRTCWPWETAATLPSSRRRKAPTGGGRGGGIPWRPPAYSLFFTRTTMIAFVFFHVLSLSAPLQVTNTGDSYAKCAGGNV